MSRRRTFLPSRVPRTLCCRFLNGPAGVMKGICTEISPEMMDRYRYYVLQYLAIYCLWSISKALTTIHIIISADGTRHSFPPPLFPSEVECRRPPYSAVHSRCVDCDLVWTMWRVTSCSLEQRNGPSSDGETCQTKLKLQLSLAAPCHLYALYERLD